MIYETLEIIKDQVSKYLEDQLGDANLVVLENIAKIDDPDVTTMTDKVVLSLINMEEELALKNRPNVHFKNGETIYKNKPINVNVYALFSANRNGYTKSLTALSSVIAFFQSKKTFNQSNTPLNPTTTALDNIKEFKFTVDLFTPTFEQLNYIWGTLGGKSVPNVLYRISIVTIEHDVIKAKGTPITEIHGTVEDAT